MKRIYIALALLLSIAACKAGKGDDVKMLPKNEMKTYCIGRHLFDMPLSFVPAKITTGAFKAVGLSTQDPSFEITVKAAGWTRSQFTAALRERREELKENESGNSNLLRTEKALSDEATLFRIQRIDDAYVSEIDFLSGSNFVTVRLESFDDKFLAAEESLINFVAGVKVLDINAEGVQPQGFCLGPVVIAGKFKEEAGSFLFRDGSGDNFDIDIKTATTGTGTPLLTRMSSPDSLLSIFDVKHSVLRARDRTVAGMPGQEWLGWTKLGEQGDQKTFGFALESSAATPGANGFNITLSFDTAQPLEDGTQTKTLLSDEKAMLLWDSVVGSIRSIKG